MPADGSTAARRRAPWLRAVPLAAALAGAPLCAAAGERYCPAGMAYAARENDESRMEYCVDVAGIAQGRWRLLRMADNHLSSDGFVRDGRKNGRLLTYADDGTAFLEERYENGHKISQRYTRAGLRKLLDEVNAQARANGSQIRWTLIDEHTARIERTVHAPLSWLVALEDETILRWKIMLVMRWSADLCKQLRSEFFSFDVLEFRYVSPEGELLNAADVPLDCPRDAPP